MHLQFAFLFKAAVEVQSKQINRQDAFGGICSFVCDVHTPS